MNYGTWIIIGACLNVLIVFSGIPTGAKKITILIISLLLLGIGILIRLAEKRRQERLEMKKQAFESSLDTNIDQVVDAIAHDVQNSVEEELEEITHYESPERITSRE